MSAETPTEASSAGLAHPSEAYPLIDFYSLRNVPMPAVESIAGEDVPEPYKRLLVHQRDMTPTLEAFYGESIHLNLIRRRQREDVYFREVVLVLDESLEPVEFGAIKINLALFASQAREWILKEYLPLGTILKRFSVTHTSRPTAFLKIQSDELMNSALGLSGSQWLYGRRNALRDPQERALAEIVEVLPPVQSKD